VRDELEKLREKSFALGEDLGKVEATIEKALRSGKVDRVKKIIDNLISETKDTKEDYDEAQQALVLFNFTFEIESKLYSLKERKGIR
jgi:hypothetical protein